MKRCRALAPSNSKFLVLLLKVNLFRVSDIQGHWSIFGRFNTLRANVRAISNALPWFIL